MASAGEKSLAVGHIPGFQIDPNWSSVLHIEQEIDDVSVFHDVFLTLASHQTLGLGRGHGAAGFHVVEGDDLGTDEAPLKVGVDLTGSLRGLGAFLDGPCPAFVLAAVRKEIRPSRV